MIWHHTTIDCAERILAEGVIRPAPVLVYRDLLGPAAGAAPIVLAAVSWWTTDDSGIVDGTVAIKGALDGIRWTQAGSYWRFGAADDVAPMQLHEWAKKQRYAPELFRWMISTATLAGSNWRDWRVCERDVTAAEWQTVEMLVNGAWVPVERGCQRERR